MSLLLCVLICLINRETSEKFLLLVKQLPVNDAGMGLVVLLYNPLNLQKQLPLWL